MEQWIYGVGMVAPGAVAFYRASVDGFDALLAGTVGMLVVALWSIVVAVTVAATVNSIIPSAVWVTLLSAVATFELTRMPLSYVRIDGEDSRR